MISKEDVNCQIQNAEFFLNGIIKYVDNILISENKNQ